MSRKSALTTQLQDTICKYVHPDHLFLGTVADNSADMVAKGRSLFGDKQPTAKLTSVQAQEIRAQRGAVLQKDLAARYGVRRTTISRIQSGARWGHLAEAKEA